MKAASDLRTKIYFFSAFFGETGRALNQSWDADLALLHQVTQTSHMAFVNLLAAIRSGSESVVTPVKEFPDALTQIGSALADWAEQQGDQEQLHAILAKLAELTFTTSGNGYYLYQKGQIHI